MEKEVSEGRNPRDIKVMFAQEIVTRFHSKQDAEDALSDFETRFKHGALPDDMPQMCIQAENGVGLPLVQILKRSGLTSSTSEAIRMIKQGGVKLDGEKVEDKSLKIMSEETIIIQVGKRKFAKISITK